LPEDRWGIPFFYASSTRNPFHYQQSDTPKNDKYLGGKDDIKFTSGEEFSIHINGPTSFYVLRDPTFTDSIDGCNMDFSEAEARGYTNKSNDLRDVEYKCLIKIEGGDGSNTMSISGPTGHHTSSNCCQGFSYMFNMSYTDNTPKFRFRKEMWHVSYHSLTEFTDSRVNFKLSGHGYIGIGYCRYNKKDGRGPGKDSVILEGWFNPNPGANIKNWFMIKRIEDKGGWGTDGDDCGGAKDQVGTWGGEHFRIKSNDSDADFTVKHLSIREIDPSLDFDDNTTPPPPSEGTPSRIYYAMVGGSTNYTSWTSTTTHEIIEIQTDPDPFKKFGADGYWIPATNNELADVCDTVSGTYGDGLAVEGYWSNSDNNCVIPHINETDLGTSTKVSNPNGGPVLNNAKVYLIYWGTDWATRSTTPTMSGLTDKIQNKLLGTDVEYFAKLSQYGSIVAPTWGQAVSNTSYPVPSGSDINESKAEQVITDTFNKGLLPIPSPKQTNQNIYILFVPVGKNIVTAENSSPAGFHDVYQTILTEPSGGGGGTGGSGGTTTIQGQFKFQQDINTLRASPCAGIGTGGGAPGGTGKAIWYGIYTDSGTDTDKELSNDAAFQNRTRVVMQGNASVCDLVGFIPSQLDIPLKKVGSPTVLIHAKIWSSAGSVIYDSPTTVDPATQLTTSFAKKTFDFSTNTHNLVVGDRIGIEFTGGTSSSYIVYSYFGTAYTNLTYYQYEAGSWQSKTRKLVMDVWE
jgi:hypothetical protein